MSERHRGKLILFIDKALFRYFDGVEFPAPEALVNLSLALHIHRCGRSLIADSASPAIQARVP